MNPRLLRPLARRQAPFSPSGIAGLVGWYDASDAATLKQNSDGTVSVGDEDPVGYWSDKSGEGNHLTQSVNNNRPVLNANATNGMPAVSFDGFNDTLVSNFSFDFAGPQELSVFMALHRRASSSSLFSMRRESGPDYLTGMLINTGDYGADKYALTWGRGGGSAVSDIGDLRSLNHDAQTWGVISASIYSPANQAGFRQRGTTPTFSSGYPLTASDWLSSGAGDHAIYVGSRAYNSGVQPVAWGDCEIAELIVYGSSVSAAETLAIESYLTNKYGF